MRTLVSRLAVVGAVALGSLATPLPAAAGGGGGCFFGGGAGATATASGSATQVFATHFSGFHAAAGFSGKSTSAVSTIETDVLLEASSGRQLLASSGQPTSFTEADLAIVQCDVTNPAMPVPVVALFGFTESGVTFTIDRQLTAASLSAVSMPLFTVDPATGHLVSAGTATASASWVGTGPINRSTSIQLFHTSGFTFVNSFTGANRSATVSAASLTQVNGGTTTTWLPGVPLVFAELDSVTTGSIAICKGSGVCK